ncbi:regulatory protein (GGDEF domain) [Legionella busanensis]|uniref:Regulatory protein (GGDEF domain) n=1 Tax=Legionella busanensis TaxID=190655 RepID=A0A378JM92_9GAMM|nr:BLUF domain-containing protein [Legionella busanensis]STX52334.1 regulatory protein (GGDEF domain) [Legionella busanensis]
MLSQLIYSSSAIASFNMDDLIYLTEQARKNNTQSDITGLLLFYQTYFFQVLEGERETISNLYINIKQDKRHTNIILLEEKNIQTRAFTKWSVGLANFPNQLPLLKLKDFFVKNCQLSLTNKVDLEPLIYSFSKGINHSYLN